MWPFRTRRVSSPKSRSGSGQAPGPPQPPARAEVPEQPLGASLAQNLTALQKIFALCSDFTNRELSIGRSAIPAQLLFVNGLTDESIVGDSILRSLEDMTYFQVGVEGAGSMTQLKKRFLAVANVVEIGSLGEVSEAVLTGSAVLLLEGSAQALKIGAKGSEARNVEEPVTEGVVRGPREGFTETLRLNTALLRRKIKTPDLKLEKCVLGSVTKTEVNIAYLEKIVNPKLVVEVRERLARIKVDAILESAYIEELIEDTPWTFLPLIEHSERPDKVAAEILSGRVAIFTDGTPFVLLVPTMMFQFMQSSEDYYDRYPYAIMIRLVRFLFLNFALLLPAVYIAVTTYHQEMIPTPLLISITAAHEGVPFPTVVEVFAMEITFEALREAGVRLPKPVGQAVSIVGALVIGQAAVEANIVSPATVIVVALTGISSFAIPSYNFASAIRLLRFIMMILASVLGMFGILLGMLVFQAHLVSLRSFGVPYFAPFAPFNRQDAKDLLIRVPWWAMGERPRLLGAQNRKRQKFFLRPGPPDESKP
ncbi:spore germination protein B1 [Peptococcaceae bacterium CEB3]|nr:spore germination protein B1 [Peptococcaceae bacterium CEB3]